MRSENNKLFVLKLSVVARIPRPICDLNKCILVDLCAQKVCAIYMLCYGSVAVYEYTLKKGLIHLLQCSMHNVSSVAVVHQTINYGTCTGLYIVQVQMNM